MRELRLLNLDKLIETEEHDSQRAHDLAENIKKKGVWTVPIAVEYSCYAIMDGHHRYNAARLLDLKRVPCFMLDYHRSGIKLSSWRDDWIISVDDIFNMVRENKKFPYKTTRHVFQPEIYEINVSINLLY